MILKTLVVLVSLAACALAAAALASGHPQNGAHAAATVPDRAHTAPPSLHKKTIVPAPLEEVWSAWTTREGIRTFFAPDGRIEPVVGGAYEIYFMPANAPGERGDDHGRVICLKDKQLLAFEWGAPPSIPEIRALNRNRSSWVVVEFESLGPDRTEVRLAHHGFLAGESWWKVHDYFTSAWDVVLTRLVHRFESGPLDWGDRAGSVPHENRPAPRTVRLERTINAPRSEVWRAWTTSEGLESFFAPEAIIEPRPMGAYAVHFSPQSAPGSRGSDNGRVIALIENDLLAFEWGAPPKFTDLRAINHNRPTWVVLELADAPSGATRIVLTHAGFDEGQSWTECADYFENAWPTVFDRLEKRFTQGPTDWSARR